MTPITDTPTVPIAGQYSNSSDTVLTIASTSAVPSAAPIECSITIPKEPLTGSPTEPLTVTEPPVPVPPITPEAHLARVAHIFGSNVETITLTDDRSYGEFLDEAKSVTALDEQIIAMPCGIDTSPCAIAFSCDCFDQLDAFLRANTWTRSTVITYWRDVMFIWLRLDGFRASNLATTDCRWIADGLVPVADLTGADSQGQFPAFGSAIKTVSTAEIKWPQIEMQEAWLLQQLEAEHGKLIQIMPDGHVEVGVATATSFTAKRLGLKYNHITDGFTMAISGDKPEPVETQKLNELITGWLTMKAVRAGVPLQVDDAVAAIISELNASCGISAPEGLKMFVEECVELKAGASVTTRELLDAYRVFCERHGSAAYSGRAFYKQFAEAAAGQFSARKAHDLMRPKHDGGLTARCGYRNLAVNCPDASPSSDPSDWPDASDGPDAS